MTPEYILTPAQQASLENLALRAKKPVSELLAASSPECGNPETACLMVPFAGMWLGIERDGHIHS